MKIFFVEESNCCHLAQAGTEQTATPQKCYIVVQLNCQSFVSETIATEQVSCLF
jgi:hypothetical protein